MSLAPFSNPLDGLYLSPAASTAATSSVSPRTSLVESSPAQRSLFLQFGKTIKRVPFPEGTITIAAINALFLSKFQGQLSGDAMPTLRIRDPSVGVFYELENPRDIKDKSVIRMDISSKQDGWRVNENGDNKIHVEKKSYFEPVFERNDSLESIHLYS